MEAIKKAFKKNKNLANEFFTNVEGESFPHELLLECYPDAVDMWKKIGLTQNVPYEWVMMMELGMVSFLTPTAVLYPIESVTIYFLVWLFFCHPGATNTSNLLRLYQNIFDIIEARARTDRQTRYDQWEQTNRKVDAAARRERGTHRSNPYSGPLDMTQSAGSLEGEGRNMARVQNRGRSCGFTAEGKKIFSWLQAEGSVNEAIATELHERFKWKRTTLDPTRSFELYFPHFGAIGAVHLEDFAQMYLETDPLGLRGKVNFMYSRPKFHRSAGIRQGNADINPDRTLPQDRANFFWTLHVMHEPVLCGVHGFESQLKYPFRVYTLTEEAKVLFDEKFDHHTEQQEASHLVNHDEAKYHAKAKTKHMRFGFLFFLFDSLRAMSAASGAAGGAPWPQRVDDRALKVSIAIGAYFDRMDKLLAEFFAQFTREEVGGPPEPGLGDSSQPRAGDAATPSVRAQLGAILSAGASVLQALPDTSKSLLWDLAREMLMKNARWVNMLDVAKLQTVKNLLHAMERRQKNEWLARAAALLARTGLGASSIANNSHGWATFHFIRRPLATGVVADLPYFNILTEFEVPIQQYRTYLLTELAEFKPPHQAEPDPFETQPPETTQAALGLAREFRLAATSVRQAQAGGALGAVPAPAAAAAEPAPGGPPPRAAPGGAPPRAPPVGAPRRAPRAQLLFAPGAIQR